MALITCKECNGQVSDQASKCPHCGVALADGTSTPGSPAAPPPPPIPRPPRAKSPVVAFLLNFFLPGFGFVYLGGGAWIVSGVLIFGAGVLAFMGSSEVISGSPVLILAPLVENTGLGIAGYALAKSRIKTS